VAEQFQLPGPVLRIAPLGNGNVNATWRVETRAADGRQRSLVLQRLNTRVFPRPELVMANIQRLGEHLDQGAAAAIPGRWEL